MKKKAAVKKSKKALKEAFSASYGADASTQSGDGVKQVAPNRGDQRNAEKEPHAQGSGIKPGDRAVIIAGIVDRLAEMSDKDLKDFETEMDDPEDYEEQPGMQKKTKVGEEHEDDVEEENGDDVEEENGDDMEEENGDDMEEENGDDMEEENGDDMEEENGDDVEEDGRLAAYEDDDEEEPVVEQGYVDEDDDDKMDEENGEDEKKVDEENGDDEKIDEDDDEKEPVDEENGDDENEKNGKKNGNNGLAEKNGKKNGNNGLAEKDDEDKTIAEKDDEDKKITVSEAIAKRTKFRRKDLSLTEDIAAAFRGADLTKEFKKKATELMEAAVITKVNRKLRGLRKLAEADMAKAVNRRISKLTRRLDNYLNYVVEQWMAENKLAVEHGLQTELVESFMDGMKHLFTEHYIQVPANKVKVVEQLATKIEKMDKDLNEEINRNLTLTKQIEQYARKDILAEVTKDMSDAQREKITALAEAMQFNNAKAFREKVQNLCESYFPKKGGAKRSVSLDENQRLIDSDKEKATPGMDAYVKAISKQVNRAGRIDPVK